MPTKLFDTVNLYDSSNAINASPAEMLLIDLGTIADDVVVTVPDASSPAALRPREGQAIGVMIYNSSTNRSVTFAGSVLNAFSFPELAEVNASVLLTWDTELLGGTWVMVASNPIQAAGAPTLFDNFNTDTPTDNTPLEPSAGEMLYVALSDATDNVPVILPATGNVGECIGLRVLAPSSPAGAFAIEPPGVFAMRRADESVIYTWDGAQWSVVINTPAMVVSEAFDNSSLSGATFTFNHILNTVSPTVSIYDDGDALVPPGPTTWQLVALSAIAVAVTFDAGLLPLPDTWHISAVR